MPRYQKWVLAPLLGTLCLPSACSSPEGSAEGSPANGVNVTSSSGTSQAAATTGTNSATTSANGSMGGLTTSAVASTGAAAQGSSVTGGTDAASLSSGTSGGSVTDGVTNTSGMGDVGSTMTSAASSSGSPGTLSSSSGVAGMTSTSGMQQTAAGGASSTTAETSTNTTGDTGSSECPDGIVDVVSVAPSGADFSSVQAAIDSIPSGSSTPTRIDIAAGTYVEKLTISGRSNLCLVGEDPLTTILSYGDSSATIGSTSGSASVHIDADDFSATNLTIENSYGSGSQAVALRVTGDRQQFKNCRFVGYQDTLYTHSGIQYFRDCYVQGNTDYVFGGATAVLDNCEVRNVEGGSAVIAPSTELASSYGIVFLGGQFTAASGVSGVALGRPWRPDGAGAYVGVELGAHIAPAGFVVMGENAPQNARFREFESTGPGANAGARSGYQMSAGEAANYTVSNIFGSWTPSYSQ